MQCSYWRQNNFESGLLDFLKHPLRALALPFLTVLENSEKVAGINWYLRYRNGTYDREPEFWIFSAFGLRQNLVVERSSYVYMDPMTIFQPRDFDAA